MYYFRLHRGGFKESMETLQSFEYFHELVNYIQTNYNCPLSIAYTSYDNRLTGGPCGCGCFSSCILNSDGYPFAWVWED